MSDWRNRNCVNLANDLTNTSSQCDKRIEENEDGQWLERNNIPCNMCYIQTHSNHIPSICVCSNTFKQHSMHMCVIKCIQTIFRVYMYVFKRIQTTFHAYVCIQNTFKYIQHSMHICVFETHSNTFNIPCMCEPKGRMGLLLLLGAQIGEASLPWFLTHNKIFK